MRRRSFETIDRRTNRIVECEDIQSVSTTTINPDASRNNGSEYWITGGNIRLGAAEVDQWLGEGGKTFRSSPGVTRDKRPIIDIRHAPKASRQSRNYRGRDE